VAPLEIAPHLSLAAVGKSIKTRPHADNLDCLDIFQYLINKLMLNAYPAMPLIWRKSELFLRRVAPAYRASMCMQMCAFLRMTEFGWKD
jgi:hypothetical protein